MKETRIADFSDTKAAAEQAGVPAEQDSKPNRQPGREQDAARAQAIEGIAEKRPVETADVAANAAARRTRSLKKLSRKSSGFPTRTAGKEPRAAKPSLRRGA